jgi:predicted PurR-regulated permease PerM
LAFVLNFIPTIGSIVASVPPILVAIVQHYPNPTPVVLTLLALLGIQFTIGNILTPKIMGDTLDLSPVVILISLMFWGIIWGVVGALLSVPIAVMIKIICENVEALDFVAVLMSAPKESHKAHTEEALP